MKTKFLFASLLMLVSLGLTAQDKEAVKKYGFKSAIVKISTDMMGQKVESTLWCQGVPEDEAGYPRHGKYGDRNHLQGW